jgi:diguanylate cyclase (GGDEF)-like protein
VLSLLLVTIILNININFFIQKIESTKEYLRTILDSQKNLVIIVEDNTVIDTNKTFLEFFNKNEKDIPNLNICSLFDKINNFNCNLHPEIFQDILDKPDAGYKVSITKNEYEYTFTLTIKHMLHNRAVIVFTDVTEIEKERQQFKESSEIDFLTNIYNRNKFNKFFDIEFEKNRRYNVNISIISFDIDHFKFVNDNFGHDIGDILLKELSMLVKNLIRTTDVFARMGGEEFVILMPNTELRPAIDLANRLNEKIKNNQFTKVDHITCSFGVTQINENDDKETFLKRADTLLYNSKNNGRNMVSHD